MNASSEPEAGLYRTLAENITDHIVRWDRAMRRVYVNPAFADAMGATADRIMGTSFGTEYSPAAAAIVRDSLAKLAVRVQGTFATGEPSEAEFRWYTAGGPRIFLDVGPSVCHYRAVAEAKGPLFGSEGLAYRFRRGRGRPRAYARLRGR